MDPVTCLLDAHSDIIAGDYASACDRINDYVAWRISGGFEATSPHIPQGGDAFVTYLNSQIPADFDADSEGA